MIMRIRTATLQDIKKIDKIGNSVNEFQVSKEVVTFWPESVLSNCIQSKNNPILVAEESKHIIGFIIANYNLCFKKAIIENIFVSPEYRGKNIGESLLKSLLKKLIALKCEYVCSLTEEKNNVAVDFYIKNGFNKGINCVWLDTILGKTFKKK